MLLLTAQSALRLLRRIFRFFSAASRAFIPKSLWPRVERMLRDQVGNQVLDQVRDQVLDKGEPASADDVEAVLKTAVAANMEALERLTTACDFAALGEATTMLRGARHVYVAGLRRSRPIADYLVYGLIRAERASSLLDFAGGMAGPQTSTITADDVLVAIAFPPYSAQVVETVMDAHVSGRRIVALTDHDRSPLAQHADVVLTIQNDAAHRLQPISAAIALVQTLILAVTAN